MGRPPNERVCRFAVNPSAMRGPSSDVCRSSLGGGGGGGASFPVVRRGRQLGGVRHGGAAHTRALVLCAHTHTHTHATDLLAGLIVLPFQFQ